MLVSLTGGNVSFLTIVWSISFSLFGVSFALCFLTVLRRLWRNRKLRLRTRKTENFKTYLAEALRLGPDHPSNLNDAPSCDTAEMAGVLLHYFRTLRGKTKEHLELLISSSALEDKLIQSTFIGIRGTRMRSLRTLSYLGSQKSFQVIFNNLSSEDKYVRLTAARCLVRREGICYLSSVVDSLIEAFPDDFKLIAGVLEGLGREGIEPIEDIIKRSENNIIKTAGLEALVLIMPAHTSLDISQLMLDPSETVRAGALALSAVVSHDNRLDPLKLGLADNTISVKIRATKIACRVKRSDVMADLYKLTKDPIMWVRYWAFRAIWMSGQSGQKFVTSRSASETMAANVALEMKSGYV